MRHALFILLFAAVLAGLMFAVRVLLIEPDEVALACTQLPRLWHCQLRDLLIQGFVRNLYGYVSVLAMVIGWLSGLRVFSVLAMMAGVAGVVLYDFDLAAVGLLLAALQLMRTAQWPQASDAKQQA